LHNAATGGAEITIRKRKAEEEKEEDPFGRSASSEIGISRARSRAGACRVGVYGVRARDGIGLDSEFRVSGLVDRMHGFV
jgi:hypothetical protein